MRNKRCRFLSITFSVFIVFSILLTSQVRANEEIEKIGNLQTEPNVVYENWSKLLEGEKENFLEPIQFSVPYERETKLNSKSINLFFANLKASYADKYVINNLKVKDQKNTMECWAFSTTSIIESNIQKNTNQKSPELSPRHIDYASTKTFLDGTNTNTYDRELKSGGNSMIAMGYCTSGKGPVLESDMPFKDEEEKVTLSEIQNKNVITKIDEYLIFPTVLKEYESNGNVLYTNGEISSNKVYYNEDDIKAIREKIKDHIIQNGAITAYTYAGQVDAIKYFNIDKVRNGEAEYSYYCNDTNAIPDHAVTIVGWDDNYSRENFASDYMPKNNGAYIVLNSYGEDKYNQGYYYISYDDFLIEYSLCGIVKTSDVEYDNIYQHDYLGYSYMYNSTMSDLFIANVFDKKTSNLKENITEISFVTNKTTNIKLYINSKDDDIAKSELVEDLGAVSAGYHTYKLKTPIEITGNKFAIGLKYSSDGVTIPMELNYKSNGKGSNYWNTAKSNFGESFLSLDGNNWYDINLLFKDTNFCIKAFTEYEEENKEIKATNVSINSNQKIEMNVNDELVLTAVVTPENTTNKEITWESSDSKIITVNNGKIKAISSGKATITATNMASGKSDSIEIIVNEEKSDIKLTKITINSITNNTIKVGDKLSLSVTLAPVNATNKKVNWKTSEEKIAKVSENGVVEAVGEGTVTIIAYNDEEIMDAILINVVSNGNNKPSATSTPTPSPNATPTPTNNPNSNNDIQIKIEDEIKVEKNEDNTLSSRNLPKAGAKIGIVIFIIVVIGNLVFVIKKNINMRDIK